MIKQLLLSKVPASALEYCVSLWQQAPFEFKVSKPRSSKLGDYRYDARANRHQVTVNGDLSPYQFLITYIHEVAHRQLWAVRTNIKPHGPEWKLKFQRIMLPVLNDHVFPDDVLRVLAKHMKNPKASTAADPKLVEVLSKYSEDMEVQTTLKNLSINTVFEFRGKHYKKLQEKRTRALCEEVKSGKRYLIPMIIRVR